MRPNLFAQAAFLLLCCGVILASPSALAQGAKSPSVLPATAFTVPMGYGSLSKLDAHRFTCYQRA